MRCEAACADVDCAWGCHSAAALLEHISLRVIAILFVRAKKLVSVEDAPPAPLRSILGGKINILACLWLHLDNIDALLRKISFSLRTQIVNSQNPILNVIYSSHGFEQSRLYSRWILIMEIVR